MVEDAIKRAIQWNSGEQKGEATTLTITSNLPDVRACARVRVGGGDGDGVFVILNNAALVLQQVFPACSFAYIPALQLSEANT